MKNECSRKLNILRSLFSKLWGASRKLLTTFYNSYIKSKFNYGIEAYSSASKTKLHTLEVLQNTAIRIITGLYKSTPMITLHLESQITNIQSNIDYNILKYFYKIQTSQKGHIIRELFYTQWDLIEYINWNTIPHKSPFLVRAICNCIKYNLPKTKTKIDTSFMYIIPPWIPFEKFFSTTFDCSSKDTRNPSFANAFFLKIIQEKYLCFSKYFTDGSKSDT